MQISTMLVAYGRFALIFVFFVPVVSLSWPDVQCLLTSGIFLLAANQCPRAAWRASFKETTCPLRIIASFSAASSTKGALMMS